MLVKRKKWSALKDAVRQNDAASVTAAASKLSLRGKEEYYNACATAVKNGNSEALDALLKAGNGFDFSKIRDMSGYGFSPERNPCKEDTANRKLACQLIEAAYAAPNTGDLLSILYKNQLPVSGRLSPERFLNEDSPVAFLETCLKDKTPYDAFRTCVEETGLRSTPKLEFILSFAADDENAPPVLAEALVTVAADNDLDKAALLLAYGANADFDGAEALRCAAKKGYVEMVDLLLRHVSLGEHGANIVTQLTHTGADAAIISSIKAAIKQAPAAVITPAAEEDDENFTRIDADTLEEKQTLSDGKTLTTLFNFRTQQQQIILASADADASPAIAVVNFDEVSQAVLDTARQRLDALNGKPSGPRVPPIAI